MRELFVGYPAILDIGTGTGRFAEYLNDAGFNVVGIDLSLSMMAKAREKNLRNLVQADAHRLPFRDGTFDGAIMIHVLHLVRDWVQVVHEVGRVTRNLVVAEVEGGKVSARDRDIWSCDGRWVIPWIDSMMVRLAFAEWCLRRSLDWWVTTGRMWMCMRRSTPLTGGGLRFLGTSPLISTTASFSGFTQRIRRRLFVVEKS